MSASVRVQATDLRQLTGRILEGAGTPSDIADTEARILVNADLKGYTSHGVFQIPDYMRTVDHGGINLAGRPTVARETSSTAFVDADNGWGHFAAEWCMALAISKARESGVGAVALAHAHHIGRLGEYAEQAAADGLASFVTTGGATGGRGGAPPYGAATGAFGTNPIAMGAPSADDRHFIADFATTALAGAKLRVLDIKGESAPPGSILDKDGNPTVDPGDAATILLFGGYKGYAIALVTCLFGALSGADADSSAMGGCMLAAIDPDAFASGEGYRDGVRAFLDGMRSVPPAAGFDEVMVHGDLERRAEERQQRDGVELPEPIWRDLLAVAEERGIDVSDMAADTA